MRADLDHIERAEVLAAKIVAALLNSTVDVRILTFVHDNIPLSDHSHAPLYACPAAYAFTLYAGVTGLYLSVIQWVKSAKTQHIPCQSAHTATSYEIWRKQKEIREKHRKF